MQKLTGYASIDMPWLSKYREGAYDRARNIPLNKTIWDLLEEKFKEDESIPALEYFKREITRSDFASSVETWARTFRAMGIEENEIVPIYGTMFPEIGAMTCALNAIGAVPYFLKLAISKQALEEETKEAKVAIVFNGMWNNVKEVFMEDRFKKIIVATAADSMLFPKKQIVSFSDYISAKKNKSMIPNTSKYIWVDDAKKIGKYYTGEYKVPFVPNRSAFITSSSGTSINGVVKGTIATNEAAISQLLKASAAEVNYNRGSMCLTNLPPTASTSLNCLFFLPLYRGMTVVNEPRLSEATYYDQMMMYKPQVALMTGAFWESFYRRVENNLKKGQKVDLSFFEMPIIGGEGLTPESLNWMNDLIQRCGSKVKMFNGYGMSEVFSVLSVEKEGFEPKIKNKDVVSVGLPYPGVKLGIFDKNGKELKYNEKGELWILDDESMMKGYYGKQELTQKTIIDGVLHTGDIFSIDEEGFLYCYGRKDNVINLGNGEKTYLFDIENKLRKYPGVKEALILAMPLSDGTTSLVAHLLLDNSIEETTIYERLDEFVSKEFNGLITIDGYKKHELSFPISPTTAKKDRNKLMKDLSGYKKVIGKDEYETRYEITENGYIMEKKLLSNSKTLKLK